MNAAKIARVLELNNIPVIEVVEGEYHEDGQVSVTDKIHVQVPSDGFGNDLSVATILDNGNIEFSALTTSVRQLVVDVKQKLGRM